MRRLIISDAHKTLRVHPIKLRFEICYVEVLKLKVQVQDDETWKRENSVINSSQVEDFIEVIGSVEWLTAGEILPS